MEELSSQSCKRGNDAEFGPVVQCDQFDFTLAFEHAILGIGLASFFLILLIRRLIRLLSESIKVRINLIYYVRVVSLSRHRSEGHSNWTCR